MVGNGMHDSFNEVHLTEVLFIVFAVLLKILQMEVMTFTVRHQPAPLHFFIKIACFFFVRLYYIFFILSFLTK